MEILESATAWTTAKKSMFDFAAMMNEILHNEFLYEQFEAQNQTE